MVGILITVPVDSREIMICRELILESKELSKEMHAAISAAAVSCKMTYVVGQAAEGIDPRI